MRFSYLRALRQVVLHPLHMQQLPIHIQVELTTYCNLQCKACMRSKYLDQSRHLSFAQFTNIVEQIRPVKISLSGGGEPFMNPEVFDMISLAKSLGASINTTTNCTLLNTETCERIVTSGLDLLKISIDGATAEAYLQSRGEDRFSEVLEGIQRLTEAKRRLGSSTPFLRFNYVIFSGNYHDMAATVDLAAACGIDAIYFQPLELIGIEERRAELVGDMSAEGVRREIERAIQAQQRSRVKSNLHVLRAAFPLYWKKYTLTPQNPESRRCILPWFSTYITLNGTVHPCCSSSQPETLMGNIFDASMETIWNGAKYQSFRQTIREGTRAYPICKNCVPETIVSILKSRIRPGFLR
ncbi:hypothetical protein CSB45_10915 [candidate division KSB3 bacterium]|uniref:Radical SAM core domain-containing protein n=1 Tax=candidate division KSB3 bacterium TaxID=2044937 RepID=A0A2G6E443_9BACT|nr:MAG: hypothetical protein CSB45_10915 [candidate division KSB3 bacterium]PIE29078.1 MAG: hypothetical protein CSA57_10690 [candidate division KSB3 bacterium]